MNELDFFKKEHTDEELTERYFRYAHDVLDGKITACEYIKLCCQRYLNFFNKEEYYFDAQNVFRVEKFLSHLKHSTGKFGSKPFLLMEWQMFALAMIFGWKYKESNLRVTRCVSLCVSRKNGKEVALDTPIITPTGYSTMGDVKVGDTIFDEEGNPCHVTYKTPIDYTPVSYEITFSDGEKIKACKDHNWYVDSWRSNKYKVMTTQEILDSGYFTERKNGYINLRYCVPLPKPLKFKKKKLPVDPYDFGVWLGDGSYSSAYVCFNGDDMDEMLSYMSTQPISKRKEKDKNCYLANLSLRSDFGKFLKEYDFKNKGKYIPKEFLINSVENRLALLQGLMDTDGYVNQNKKNGSVMCEITQKNDNIADGICFLLDSFGIKYNNVIKVPTINGVKKNPVHRISFNADKTFPVFRLKRKLNMLPEHKGKADVKYIKDIKPIDPVPMQCITVDSPNHLYLAGKHNTVTHNTSFFAGIMLYCLIADGEKEASCLLAANSAAQAQICFDMCSNYLKSIDPDNKHFKRYRQIIRYGDSKIKVCPAIADRLDGENASVFIEDECHAAPSSAVYDVLVSSQGMRSQPLAMVCSTRGFNLSSWYYSWDSDMIDILQGVKEDDSVLPLIYTLDEGDDYHDENVWTKASPSLGVTVTKEYLRQMVRRADNDPQQLANVQTKLMNMWCASSNAWIPMQNVMKCFDKVSLNDYKDTYCIIGLDLASVSDLTALTVMLPMEEGFVFKNFYFFPREQLKYSQNAALYQSAEKNGDLIITEGNVCDYDYVKDLILKINAVCPVQTIAYDQWNSSAFIISLQKEGFSNCLKPFSQSIQSFNKPVKDLNRRILLEQVKIDKNILTRFCFQNAKLYIDANENYKIIKESAEQKIDGIVSMCDALGSYLDENDIPLQVDTINF